jgi:hypothetical protein
MRKTAASHVKALNDYSNGCILTGSALGRSTKRFGGDSFASLRAAHALIRTGTIPGAIGVGDEDCIRITGIIPGSPAEIAGLASHGV